MNKKIPQVKIEFLTPLKPVTANSLCGALRDSLKIIWLHLSDDEKRSLITQELPEVETFSLDDYYNGLTSSEIFSLFKDYPNDLIN